MLCLLKTKNQIAIAGIIRGWIETSEYDDISLSEKISRNPAQFLFYLYGYKPIDKDTLYEIVQILKPKNEQVHEFYFLMAFDEEEKVLFIYEDVWPKSDSKRIQPLTATTKINGYRVKG